MIQANPKTCSSRSQELDVILYVRFKRGGTGGPPPPPPPPPPENHKTKGFFRWSGSPEKSQSGQTSIQCWAIIDPPAKRHLNGVSLAVDDGPLLVLFGSSFPVSKKSWTPSGKTFWVRACFCFYFSPHTIGRTLFICSNVFWA